MSTFKFEITAEVEAADVDDAEDILTEILDAEPVLIDWHMRAIGG